MVMTVTSDQNVSQAGNTKHIEHFFKKYFQII